jgi:signal transduction histidine kinase
LSLIWLADDSSLEREIARRALGKHHQVIEFDNGEAVLERLSSGAPLPDVLVIDYQLPSLSGIDVTRHLRRRMSASELPVLVVSSTFTASEDIVAGLEAGANDYVLKPFAEKELIARVEALAQAKLQRQRAELAERSLRKLLQHQPDAFIAVDLDGRITFVNRAAERVLDRDWSELLSQQLGEVIPALGGLHQQGVAPPVLDVVIGERHYEPGYGRLILDEQLGETVTVTLRDVTEKVQAIDRRDAFLAMLGHELRNPLAPILSAAQLLRGPLPDPQQVEHAGGVILRQAERMVRIVDDLLDVSRVSRGRIEIRPEPVDVAAAVDRALESTQPLVAARGHEIAWERPTQGLWVSADPLRFEQMLTNLMTNAAKYSGTHGHIQVAARADGEFVEVAVRDNGIGIAPSQLESIFELFVQIDDSLSRSEGGLGIGLPLVRQLAQMHGGTVLALSEGLGKGAEFVVRLPAAQAPAVVKPRPAKAPGRARRVLLVDDNVDAVELISHGLRRRGHTIASAHDGIEAISVAADFGPEIAFLDIGLPGLDGYELARRLRASMPGCRLIAVTGYGRPEDAARALEAGFDLHLVKPVTFEAVEKILAADDPRDAR